MSHDGPLTFIAAGTTIRGEIHSEEDLTIEGRVEGSVTATGVITIAETGEVVSNVAASDVVVLGGLEGDIQASGTVEIGSGGRVEGDIRAARVILSEGAVFRGSIDMGAATERPRKHAVPQRTAARPATPVETRKHVPQPERFPEVERPRRSAPPQTAPVRPAPVVHDAPVPLRAPEPRVRGVGRTQAFKK